LNQHILQEKKIKLKIVIKEYLRLISNKALNKINTFSNEKKYEKKDISWIVTVPAIWDESGKQFMLKCSKEAGMEDIKIALEPEAASLTMFNDDIIDNKLKKKGKKFMLIDAGGYTIDITINEILDEEGNLKQLSPPSGGSYGSMNINIDIFNLIKEIFNNIKTIKDKDRKQLLSEIEEDIKKNYCEGKSDSEEFKISQHFSIRRFYQSNVRYYESKEYGKIKYDDDYIYIERSIIKRMILKQINKIITHTKKLIDNYKGIEQIVLAGGFFNCELLVQEFYNSFPGMIINKLSTPELSVMLGAGLYGINPNQILYRISPYTIGTNYYKRRIKNTECRNEVITEEGKIECEYFDTFIKKGELVKNNFQKSIIYNPLRKEQTKIIFYLYSSDLIEQIYIDKNIELIGSFDIEVNDINIPRNERKINVTMIFGSCIKVQAKNLISGKIVEVSANYYKRD